MSRTVEKWPTEAAMFESFVAFLRGRGFRVYPECCGHDLIVRAPEALQVRDNDSIGWGSLRPGDVVAIEGKLRSTVEVLSQALPPHVRYRHDVELWPSTRPPRKSANWYAVLVPGADLAFREIAAAAGVVVLVWPFEARWRGSLVFPSSRRIEPAVSLALPEVEVDLSPGQPSPRSITPWKLRAVRACLVGVARGGVLAADDIGDLQRNFARNGWIVRTGGKGKSATYRLLDRDDRPDLVYPEIAAAIRPTIDGDAIVAGGAI